MFRIDKGMVLYRSYNAFKSISQRVYNLIVRYRFNNSKIDHIDRSARIEGFEYIKIGDNFIALLGFRLEAFSGYKSQRCNPKLIIKNNVTVNDYVHIGCINSVEIGNNVLIASKVFISDHSHGNYLGPEQDSPESSPAERILSSKAIVIEDNVWIGEGVTILPGVRIGFGCIIGAHSVVTRSIPPRSIAVGVPAKVIKTYNHSTMIWELVN